MLIGFHLEGYDFLIIRTLIERLLGLDDDAIQVDHIDQRGMGWRTVLDLAPRALRRFYGKCCALAVLGVDNDGNRDVLNEGLTEDPDRPRHWLHGDQHHPQCRHCQLRQVADSVRPQLTWMTAKPGASWPILVCVPVEMIESWLLVASGSTHAENERRQGQKTRVYGRPEPTREDVEGTALPMLRTLSTDQLQQMGRHARSFQQFADQVLSLKRYAGLGQPCWT